MSFNLQEQSCKEGLLEWRKMSDDLIKLHQENVVSQEDRVFRNGWGCISNSDIDTIVFYKPKSLSELADLRGFGKTKVSKYGNDIVEIVNSHF